MNIFWKKWIFSGREVLKVVAYCLRKIGYITKFTVIPVVELSCIVLRGNNFDANDS